MLLRQYSGDIYGRTIHGIGINCYPQEYSRLPDFTTPVRRKSADHMLFSGQRMHCKAQILYLYNRHTYCFILISHGLNLAVQN